MLEETIPVQASRVIQESIGYVVTDTVVETGTRVPFIVSSNPVRLCSVDNILQTNNPTIIQTLVQQIEVLEQHEKITLTALQNANIAFNEMVNRIKIIENHNTQITQMLNSSNTEMETLKTQVKSSKYHNLSFSVIMVWLIGMYFILHFVQMSK